MCTLYFEQMGSPKMFSSLPPKTTVPSSVTLRYRRLYSLCGVVCIYSYEVSSSGWWQCVQRAHLVKWGKDPHYGLPVRIGSTGSRCIFPEAWHQQGTVWKSLQFHQILQGCLMSQSSLLPHAQAHRSNKQHKFNDSFRRHLVGRFQNLILSTTESLAKMIVFPSRLILESRMWTRCIASSSRRGLLVSHGSLHLLQ